MKVVAIASRKGGSGKTTLAGHLAVQAEIAGTAPVVLIDVDPQGSLAKWWNLRTRETPYYVQTSIEELSETVERLRERRVRLLFIDTPPSLDTAVGEVIRCADLVLIPSRPSPHDLRSIGATVKLVEHLGKPLVFAVNGAAPRAKITNEAIQVLSQHGPLAPSIIHQRVDFAASMVDGRTVMELSGAQRAASEIAELWRYLADRLEGEAPQIELPPLPKRSRAAEIFAAE
ncbi:MAG: ParA family protein [Kiloniellales bacterium]|nr:ParA family protein [Kiloniellales bacterium]